MAITLKGLVYYADDPDKKVFRSIHLAAGDDDADFFDIVKCEPWLTQDLDPVRKACLKVVPIKGAQERHIIATPFSPPTTNNITPDGGLNLEDWHYWANYAANLTEGIE